MKRGRASKQLMRYEDEILRRVSAAGRTEDDLVRVVGNKYGLIESETDTGSAPGGAVAFK